MQSQSLIEQDKKDVDDLEILENEIKEQSEIYFWREKQIYDYLSEGIDIFKTFALVT